MFKRLKRWWLWKRLPHNAKKWSLKHKHAAYEVMGDRGIAAGKSGKELRKILLLTKDDWRNAANGTVDVLNQFNLPEDKKCLQK